MSAQVDVLIAGAGPTGLALACGLLANGITVRVVDKAGEPAGGFQGVPLPERFLLADVHADLPLSRHSIYVWLAGDTVFGAFPLPGRDLWRLMAPATSDAADEHSVLAQIGRLFEERTGHPASVIRDPEWITSFRLHRRLADTYRDRRILLAGDAAHVFSPFGGQGMNTGIGDAENLAWKLALVINGTAEPDLLDTYEGERRPIIGSLLKSTSAISKLMLGNHLLARLMRDRVVIPLMNRPGLQRRLWENFSQMKVSYRNGPSGGRRATGRSAGIRGQATGSPTSSACAPTAAGHTCTPNWVVAGH